MNFRNLLSITFPKRLPSDFGGERILVTARADIRVLRTGWDGAAFDLKLVVNRIVRPGMVVWDIGANQGILSFMAAYRVGPEGAIYALEADPAYANLIFRSGQRLSAAYQKVNVLCAAISNRNGLLEFAVSERGHARNKLAELADDSFQIAAIKMVPTLSGDHLLESWRPPDFIKMDVEGAECMALQGMEKVLTTVRPVMYIEVSDVNKTQATLILREYGYNIFHLKGDGREEPIEACSFYTIARPKN